MNSLSPIKFTIQLTSNDMLRFNFDYLMKGFKKVIYILLYVIIIPFCIVRIITSEEISALSVGVIMVGLLIPPLLIFQIKKNFKSHKNLHEPIEYTIDEENIHLKGLTFESTISVQNLHKVTEKKGAFYLWQSNVAANYIPKRLLSQADIDALSAWRESVSKKK